MSLSDIYPDKHDALRLAGQLKLDQKMRTLGAVLDDESDSGPARLEKKSRAIDKRDSFLVIKYASLGHSQRPLVQTVKNLRNAFRLKWLRPRVVFSRHTNLQEKLLGDLRRKLLVGIVDADFGPRPCNCPRKFKVDGVCAYGGSRFTCRTAGCVYKITCNVPDCRCFYIGKSQRYIKTRIQDHIGEVTKLYNKNVLLPNSDLVAHVKNQRFNTKAEVAEWCRSNISVDILWRSTTLSLVKTAGQKSCRLCATKRVLIGQNITG